MKMLDAVEAGFREVEADPTLKARALTFLRRWLTEAAFTAYRPQIGWLIQQRQWAGLLDRFYQIVPFGTGGRRGAVGIGPNRMNLWTLGASVQGHCEYLKERFPGTQPLRVVLAYDVRRFEDRRGQYSPGLPNPVLHLSSRDLAHHAATIYAANGIQAITLSPDSKQYLATPELSFTLRQLHAHGGLNVSASHNPPDDNGGKFYDERGGQPVPPDDQIMADLVEQVDEIKYLPWAEAVRCGRVQFLDEAPHQAYLDLTRKQSLAPPPGKREDFTVVFTPLHGVGSMTAMEALVAHGFRVLPVAEQMEPDGQFPNVTRSPNPEVPESMDRAAALARLHQADLVLATDPDADRIGAMIPDGDTWRFVTGNEIAALLTHYKLSQLAQKGRLPRSPLVLLTEVTTSLVTRIARHFGAQVIDNLLVGFKYVADVLWQLEQSSAFEDVQATPEDFVIAVEESHGVLLTAQIRDKDAAGAALLLAELTLEQKRRGRNVAEYLENIARQFGYFRNEGVPVFMTGISGRDQMMRMLNLIRTHPPRVIGGLVVTDYEDLRNEEGRLGPLRGATDAASRNVLVFRCGDSAKVILRPSGTEPKAKIYVEVSSPPCEPGTTAETWRATCAAVDAMLRQLSDDFVRQALAHVGLDASAAGVR